MCSMGGVILTSCKDYELNPPENDQVQEIEQNIPKELLPKLQKYKLAKTTSDSALPVFMAGKIVEMNYPNDDNSRIVYTEYTFEYHRLNQTFKKTYVGTQVMYPANEDEIASSGGLQKGRDKESKGSAKKGEPIAAYPFPSVDINKKEKRISINSKLKKKVKLSHPELEMPLIYSSKSLGITKLIVQDFVGESLGKIVEDDKQSGMMKMMSNGKTGVIRYDPTTQTVQAMAMLDGSNMGIVQEIEYVNVNGFNLGVEIKSYTPNKDGKTSISREIYRFDIAY